MSKLSSKARGWMKEQLVSRHLKKKGWKIIFQNKKILGVEIDILARKQKEQILVEVKSIRHIYQTENIIKEKQKERLKKVAEVLCEDSIYDLRLFLATVDSQNKINFFEIVS